MSEKWDRNNKVTPTAEELDQSPPINESVTPDGKIEERGQWGHSAEFILSCLGYAVGLGNVWRFPHLVYQNGGGAFLIPYVIMMIFVGLPIFFMEMIVGQFSSSGPVTIWSISPVFKGIGAGMVVITFMTSINYNMVMGWSFYYLFASWQKVLPWYDCKNTFNTPYCYTKREARECEKTNGSVWFNLTCFNESVISSYDYLVNNCSDSMTTTVMTSCVNQTFNDFRTNTTNRVSASEEYFYRRVLDKSSSIDETGEMKYELVLILLFAWVVAYLCVIKGIKSAGKVVYFTATFPYFMLIVLLIRGAILPGAEKGVNFYIKPQWEQLNNAKVWVDAAGQVFFSLGVGMGVLMTYSSYNKFNNNIYRDTLIVVILDGITSFFAGFVIFSILGHLAETLERPVSEVAKAGSGLAFIAYPEVVTYMEPPQLWSSLFFLMLVTLGLDTQMAAIETIMTAILDLFPKLRKWKPLVTGITCAVLFLLGLTLCTQAGEYWMDLMIHYSSGWSLVLIALCEAIVFPWFYGAKRLIEDVQTMTGVRLYKHWWFCFKFISPALLIAILIFSIIDFTPLQNGEKVWSQVLGWLMAVVSVALIPVFAVYVYWDSFHIAEYDGLTYVKRLMRLTQPSSKWMPGPDKIKLHSEAINNDPQVVSSVTNVEKAGDSGNGNIDQEAGIISSDNPPDYSATFTNTSLNDL